MDLSGFDWTATICKGVDKKQTKGKVKKKVLQKLDCVIVYCLNSHLDILQYGPLPNK